MALLPLLSFSGGELDPILHDNVTLDKFRKGLATARNVVITKTGSASSRFGRQHFVKSKNSGQAIKCYSPVNSNSFLEFGHNYVRIYNLEGFAEYGISQQLFAPTPVELVTTYTESDLPYLHFETSKNVVYIFREGKKIGKLYLAGSLSSLTSEDLIFAVPPAPATISVTAFGTPSGYPPVVYCATVVINGEESLAKFTPALSVYPKPAATGQSNTIEITYATSLEVTEMRVYSKPVGGGAYGLLGVSTDLTYNAGTSTWTGTLMDFGQLPDYTIGLQELITNYGLNRTPVIDLKPKTGVVYQQRLILGNVLGDNEALLASRPGYHNNFYRDFPYAADSTLQFKSGTSGKAEVLRIIESEGLIVFTTVGTFTSSGVLSVDNPALVKRGGWIIDESIPPLIVPGGVFFVDKSNAIRQLLFSQEIMGYDAPEMTIFSNHLFKDRKITSWCFQNGKIPVIIVTFNDGNFATFTYNFEHQMRAWTRHDSKYPVEEVVGTDLLDRAIFVTNKDGDRYIEMSLPRVLPIEVRTSSWAGQDSDKYATSVFMDAVKSTFTRLNDLFDIGDHFIVAPVSPDDWSGNLTLTNNTETDYTGYTVGTVFRFFHPVDRSAIDLEIVGYDGIKLVVSPSEEFPSEYAQSTKTILYRTFTTIVGLSHLEGEEVSVVADGHLVASPYNTVGGYPSLVVTGGEITLPERGAIVHVGRPIVADVKTLKSSTVEQSPTLIESMTANKLYVKVNESRGLFCSNEYPEEINEEVDGSSVEGMEDLDFHYVPRDGELIGNASPKPVSKRLEVTIQGDWNNNGQISLRQVDPFHFEIISIISDLEIERRSDR